MKYGHLDRYRVQLEVKTPLFIGNGEKLRQSEYIVQGNKWLVPSMPGLINELVSKDMLNDFEKYLSDATLSRTQKLGTWLSAHKIQVTENAAWVSYSLQSNITFTGMSSGNDLAQFIKLPDGSPYIPGSSIKGAIRSAYIAENMTKTDAEVLLRDVQGSIGEKKAMRRSGAEEAIPRVLRYEKARPDNAVCDILKGLEISDSAPFRRGSLMVCRVNDAMDRAYSDRRPNLSPLPLYRECIKPGEKTTFYISIDRLTLPDMSVNDIRRMLQKAMEREKSYAESFDLYNLDVSECDIKKGCTPLILGAGTGFQTKSLILHAGKTSGKDSTALAHKALSSMFPYKGKGKGYYKPPCGDASPAPYCRKLAEIGKVYCPFGRCELTFETEN